MGAVATKTRADLARRRLTSVVLALVLFLAAAAGTLALAILVESRAPFDRAFAEANGAHLVLHFAPSASPVDLAATATAPRVTAAAGPWAVGSALIGHPKGGIGHGSPISARPRPDGPVDTIAVIDGRWWQRPGEVVISQSLARRLEIGVGDAVDLYPQPADVKQQPGAGGDPVLGTPVSGTVVGVAQSVSTPNVDAWLDPGMLASLQPGHRAEQEMLYRVDPAATAADLAGAAAAITGSLPQGSVTSSATYLDAKAGVDRLADLYVPVLLAFSIFAVIAAAFTISNVVSGVVLAGRPEIGVMKAIGFTPAQVTGILLADVLVPVVVGSVAGVVVGTIASQPILAQTAESFGLPATGSVSLPVIVAVLLTTIATALLAALLPALRAGRISPVAAMTRGASGSAKGDAARLRRIGFGLPLWLPARLGIGSGLAHPGRAAMTAGALVVGVAAVTLSIGLDASLLQVKTTLGRTEASPVRAELRDPSTPTGEVAQAIAAKPDTGRVVSIGSAQVGVPSAGTLPFVGYDGDASWLGYALIQGRWFASPGEAVAPTNLFRQAGLQLGDVVTLTDGTRSVPVRLVGEIFDDAHEHDDNLVIRGTWSDLLTLDPASTPTSWEMQPRAGVDAQVYANEMHTAIDGVQVYFEGDSHFDESFALFLTVVGLLGIVLTVISLGGVFNTVLLETRQRTREIAVLKAIGLRPVEVTAMVLASIVPIGLVAGAIGVPLGIAAQHAVLTYMGEVAVKTGIPPVIFDVFSAPMLIGLALAGLAIGMIGALVPAQRAARARIAPVLAAE